MVTFVCLCNLLLALINFLIAWQLWKLRRTLLNVTKNFIEIEIAASLLLAPTREVIVQGQKSTYTLRQQYLKLQWLIQQLQSTLALLSWGHFLLRQLRRSGLLQSQVKLKKGQLLSNLNYP